MAHRVTALSLPFDALIVLIAPPVERCQVGIISTKRVPFRFPPELGGLKFDDA